MRLWLAVALLVTSGELPGIVGTWRGTSLCSDKVAFPSCNDEQAIYEIRYKAHDTVIVKADKVVAGKREEMSVFEFAQQRDGSWKTEVATPRYRLRIVLRAAADSITGTLTDLGVGKKVRDIALRREKGR